MSGGVVKWRAKTVMPVPPGTALHQLYSVPPTGRDLCCCSDMFCFVGKTCTIKDLISGIN